MSEPKKFDLIVIGGGPGGYVAAIRAAQLGLSTALVEKMNRLGGTCLNVGCIPSKALLDSSHHYHDAAHSLADHGIHVSGLSVDIPAMIGRKAEVVTSLTKGIETLIKGNKIAKFNGTGILKTGSPEHRVEVYENASDQWDASLGGLGVVAGEPKQGKLLDTLTADRVILATGSVPVELPFMPFDGKQILSSTGMLCLDSVPKTLTIVGAGAIGLEMASVWARLGSKVHVVEMMKQILPGWDAQIARVIQKELKDLGIEFHLGNGVEAAKVLKSGVKLTLKSEPGELKTDAVLVAVGRKANIVGAGAAADALARTEDGRRLAVNGNYETNIPGVYAIGDLIHGPMLAHKAEDDAVTAVERMCGIPAHFDYEVIPGVLYSYPEAATVGSSEEALKAEGIKYSKGVFPLVANGRALAMGAKNGFVKILADEAGEKILGAHIVGPWASDLISEIVTVMEMKGNTEDIARIIHAHPTLPEGVREAAMAVKGRSIHSLR